ncbi:MAG TPA: 2-hydroxyacid dehydrogenase [Thermoanaerobaculia bacterium]|nr:2-hydroxyacid dehydrogenase [Thermoanaerobaculia bacterium]
MNGSRSLVVVSASLGSKERGAFEAAVDGAAEVAYLEDAKGEDRVDLITSASVVASWIPQREFGPTELKALAEVELIQMVSAGVDHVPFAAIPDGPVIASNAGAYAEPMAEHALAMILALAKRLLIEHRALARGEFRQRNLNRRLAGGKAAIVGYGGTGQATARLLRAIGMTILAVNTSGKTGDSVEFAGKLEDLHTVLSGADVVLLSLPLTVRTGGLIGAPELGWMKEDAILVNVARGELVDQKALYEHLAAHPSFQAGIESWWIEPLRHGEFRVDYPFLDLENFLGCPHNSAMVEGALADGARIAGENVARFLAGEKPHGLVRRADYLTAS